MEPVIKSLRFSRWGLSVAGLMLAGCAGTKVPGADDAQKVLGFERTLPAGTHSALYCTYGIKGLPEAFHSRYTVWQGGLPSGNYSAQYLASFRVPGEALGVAMKGCPPDLAAFKRVLRDWRTPERQPQTPLPVATPSSTPPDPKVLSQSYLTFFSGLLRREHGVVSGLEVFWGGPWAGLRDHAAYLSGVLDDKGAVLSGQRQVDLPSATEWIEKVQPLVEQAHRDLKYWYQGPMSGQVSLALRPLETLDNQIRMLRPELGRLARDSSRNEALREQARVAQRLQTTDFAALLDEIARLVRDRYQAAPKDRDDPQRYARLMHVEMTPIAARLRVLVGQARPERDEAALKVWVDARVMPALKALNEWFRFGNDMSTGARFLGRMGGIYAERHHLWSAAMSGPAWQDFVWLRDQTRSAQSVPVAFPANLALDTARAGGASVPTQSGNSTRWILFGTPSQIAAARTGVAVGQAAVATAAAAGQAAANSRAVSAELDQARLRFWRCVERSCAEESLHRAAMADALHRKDQLLILAESDLMGGEAALFQQLGIMLAGGNLQRGSNMDGGVHPLCRNEFNQVVSAASSGHGPDLRRIAESVKRWARVTDTDDYRQYVRCRDEIEYLLMRP